MGLIEKLAVVARRIFPEKFLRNLDRRLGSTNIALSADEYIGVVILASILIGFVVGFLCMIFGLPAPFLLAILSVLLTIPALSQGVPYYLIQRRAAEIERSLPDVFRQMASLLRAGVGVEAAMEDIVRSNYGVVSDEFDRALTQIRRGRKLDSAFLAMARRSNSPLCDRAFRLIVEGIERGAALASVLDSVSTDTREVHAIQRERRATTTQQVMFLLAVSLFLVPFIIGLGFRIIGTPVAGPVQSPPFPKEMGTIAMLYIMIQASICSLAVGVIRYGKISKGLTRTVPYAIISLVVFHIAQIIIGGVIPAGA